MRSGWCLRDYDDHHKCRPGPWSNGQQCECVCHTGSEEGKALIAAAEERESARLERMAEAERVFQEMQGEAV